MINFEALHEAMENKFFTKVELKMYCDAEGYHGYFLRDGKRHCEVIGVSVKDILEQLSTKVELP